MERAGNRGPESAVPTSEIIAGLNDLLQLDHDAVGAYEIAVERLENREQALQIEGFKRDHERHIRELNELILMLGGSPMNEPHATAPLKQAMQQLAATVGDRALLGAWRANELQSMAKYDRYASLAAGWPPEAKRLVDQNALDEERHYQWVVDLLSGGDSAEVHLANRARERISVASRAVKDAREQLADATGTARVRAASGLESAASRLERFAADETNGDGLKARAADGAHRIAQGLETTAEHLRDGGAPLTSATIETQIRAHPAPALAASFAVGFIIGRILR